MTWLTCLACVVRVCCCVLFVGTSRSIPKLSIKMKKNPDWKYEPEDEKEGEHDDTHEEHDEAEEAHEEEE